MGSALHFLEILLKIFKKCFAFVFILGEMHGGVSKSQEHYPRVKGLI